MRGPRGPHKNLKPAHTVILSYDMRKLSGSMWTPHIQKCEFFFHIRMRVNSHYWIQFLISNFFALIE